MRILYVAPRFPYPPLKGDQVITYNRLRYLSLNHEIILVAFYEKDEELQSINIVEQYCNEMHLLKLTKSKSFFNIGIGAISSNLPLQVLYYRSDDMKKCLKKIIGSKKIDIIHACMFRIAEYLQGINIPKVIDLIDSMQLNLERRISLETNNYKKLVLKEELRRVKAYENILDKYFDHLILVAELDKQFFPVESYKKISIIPNGVDTELFSPIMCHKKKYDLIFSGNMSYEPNIHAVKWFAEQCFPLIKKQYPNITWCIAGGNPSSEVIKLQGLGNVYVTGFVNSMTEYLNKARISIAPMQSGSGMQNKILEAMACGLPVVTTRLGLGSIKAKNYHEICIADTPEEFASTILKLLKSPDLSKNIGLSARNYVVNNHSWENVSKKINAIYNSLVSK